MQINPPYDGSAPCPMCPILGLSIYAYAHNMMNRWRKDTELPEPKFWQKLDDLNRTAQGEAGFADPRKATAPIEVLRAEAENEDVKKFLDVVIEIVTEYRRHPRPETREQAVTVFKAIKAQCERLREVQPAIELLVEAHHDDRRHAGGDDNILREEKGWSESRGGDYHWTVALTGPGTGDLVHTVCGAEIKLHQHFKDRLARDAKFYARIHCPRCLTTLPAAQFVPSAKND